MAGLDCSLPHRSGKANTKQYLIDQGIVSMQQIGAYHKLTIKQSKLSEFREVMEQLKEHGLKKYGIEANWLLMNGKTPVFNERAFKAVDILNGVYRNDHLDASYYLRQVLDKRNAELMDEYEREQLEQGAIERAEKELQQGINDPEYYAAPGTDEEFFTESSEIHPETPVAEKVQGLNRLIKLKEKLLENAKKELNQVNALLREARTDAVRHKQLLHKKSEISGYIKGNEETEGLEDELDRLRRIDTRSPELIAPFIEKELLRLEKLVKSDKAEDLKEARDIIQFIEAMSNFKLADADKHPIYDKRELYDEDDNFRLTADMMRPFQEWATRARLLETPLVAQERRTIEKVFNNNDNIRKMFGEKKFTYDEIILASEGLKDAHWIDMMVMDITAGILSQNGMLPQIAKKIVDDGFEIAFAWSKDIATRLDAIMPEVEAEMDKLDGGKYKLSTLGILGPKGHSFDWIKQAYRNGLETGNMATKYSAEWFDVLSIMRDTFRQEKKKANQYEDWTTRINMITRAYEKRRAWLMANTVMLNPAKIKSIAINPAFSSMSDSFASEEEMEAHEKEMIALVGKRHFDKMVEEQTNLLLEYQIQRQEYLETRMAETSARREDDLPPASRAKMRIWDEKNNPFIGIKHMEHGSVYDTMETRYFSELSYNVYAPKRDSSNFYDENFEKIESNEVLMKFYEIALEATTKIKEQFDVDTQRGMLDTSIPFIEKSFTEMLLDKGDLTFWQILSERFRQFIDSIKTVAGINIEDEFNYARVNVITGQPEYTVNDYFIKQGANKIHQNFVLNSTEFVQNYNATLGMSRLSKFTGFTVLTMTRANQTDMARLLQPYLRGITPETLRERYPDGKIPAGKIIKAYSQHQVAQEKSFDLPKIIRHFSDLSSQHAARNTMLPMLELLKRHYEKIEAPMTQNTDQALKNAQFGASGEDRTQFGGVRIHANRQFNNWFERVVLGDNALKKHYGFFKQREINPDDPDGAQEEIDFLTKFVSKLSSSNFDGKVLTSKDKILLAKVNSLLAKETDENTIKSLEAMKSRIGRQASLSGFMENVMNFMRFKGMGFNVSSAITNIAEGQLANSITASQGHYFPSHYIDTLTLSEMMYSDSLSKMNSSWALPKVKKYQLLLERWDILQDSRNELQKASAKTAFTNLNRLDPYYMQSKGESYNQMPLMAALLRNTPILDEHGNESNVGDALEMDGEHGMKLKEEFRTGEIGQQNIENWEKANGQQYRDFKSKMKDLIRNTHGDYDKTSGMMAKSYHAGLIATMFKTWLPREIYKRFATEQNNTLAGIKGFKGRYHSHTAATGLFLGAGVALVPFGIPGAIAFGVGGAFLGKGFGSKNLLSFAEESLFISKLLTRKVLGFPINFVSRTAGKGNVIEVDVDRLASDKMKTFSKEFTAVDYANWKGNMQETSTLFMFIGLLLLCKGFTWDDDDKEGDPQREAHNLLANRFIQLSGSIGQYSNPVEMYKTISDVAIFKTFKDALKLLADLDKTLKGQGTLTSGPHVGENRAVIQAKKTFLPGIIAHPLSLGFSAQMERQFVPTEVDSWFWGEEKDAKVAVGQIRAEAKAEQGESYEGKKYAKKKGESYVELLKRIAMPGFMDDK